jgi:hypothetical protein
MPRKPGKDEVWSALAVERGGEVGRGRRGKVKLVRFRIGAWALVLDTFTESSGHSSHMYTRLRVAYRAADDFRFRIYRRTVFSDVGKFFGMQDIDVGMDAIDRDYVVQSNGVGKVQSMVFQPEVAGALAALRAGRLQARKLRKAGVDTTGLIELSYVTGGDVKDPDRLRRMLDLVCGVLEYLARSGSATRDAVTVEF